MNISDLAKKGIIKDFPEREPIEEYEGTDFEEWGKLQGHNKVLEKIESCEIDEEKLMKAYGYVKKEEVDKLKNTLSAYSKATCLECGATLIDRVDYLPSECPYCRANRLMKENEDLKKSTPLTHLKEIECLAYIETHPEIIKKFKKRLKETQ